MFRLWGSPFVRRPIVLSALLAGVIGLCAAIGCGSRDSAEEHRRLSLRVEHRPPGRTPADSESEIHATVRSSLEAPRLEAWVRILGDREEDDEQIPLRISETGEAVAKLPAHSKGTVIRYVVEARDAAGLVVALPRGARDGKSYSLRYEGSSSRVLGGISWLSAVLGVLFFLGAGAAAAQALRGRMSVGPSAMLGGFGAAVVVLGLLVIGGIHALQLTGNPWPSRPVMFGISRAELGLVALLWVVNLILGRRLLLDEAADDHPPGQRAFAVAGAMGGILTVVFLLL